MSTMLTGALGWRSRDLIDPESIPLIEAGFLTTQLFSGVRTRIVGEYAHLLFYVTQPSADGDVDHIIVARMTAPTSIVWATAETISATIAQPQLAAAAASPTAN